MVDDSNAKVTRTLDVPSAARINTLRRKQNKGLNLCRESAGESPPPHTGQNPNVRPAVNHVFGMWAASCLVSTIEKVRRPKRTHHTNRHYMASPSVIQKSTVWRRIPTSTGDRTGPYSFSALWDLHLGVRVWYLGLVISVSGPEAGKSTGKS